MRKASFGHCGYPYLGIGEKEREYLRQSPAFDLNDELGGQKGIFGPFIEWFIQSALCHYRAGAPPSTRDMLRDDVRAITANQGTSHPEGCTPPGKASMDWPETGVFSQWFTGGSLAEGEAILWLTMQSICMFEFILSCIINSDGKRRLGRPEVRNVASFSETGKTRTAKVVLFGVFQAEDILMSNTVLHSAGQQLLASTPRCSSPDVPADDLMASPPTLDIPLVLEDLYLRSGIPNLNHGRNVPPPPLQPFTFLLKNHFNLQFHESVFDTTWRAIQDYHFFKNRATIFANGPEEVPQREWFDYTNGTEFLVKYQPPFLTFFNGRDIDDINPRAWNLENTSSY
jgi:hypothetical protein